MTFTSFYDLEYLIKQLNDPEVDLIELQEKMEEALHAFVMASCKKEMDELGILFEYGAVVH